MYFLLALFIAAPTGCSTNSQENQIRPEGYQLQVIAAHELNGAYSSIEQWDKLSVFERTKLGEQGKLIFDGAIAVGNSFKDFEYKHLIMVGIYVPEDKKQEITDAMEHHGITLTVTDRSTEGEPNN